VRADADHVVSTLLPGLSTFSELFTRARIALFTDDYDTSGLPNWTQYHQFRLRDSRPAGSLTQLDPRVAWPRLRPGEPFADTRVIPPGAATGYVIDGGSRPILIDTSGSGNGAISITRIR
jgi:hypothetical protein